MATAVQYAFRYDGNRYYAGQAVWKLKQLAVYYGFYWDKKKSTWQNCVDTFQKLPDYNNRLVVFRRHKQMRKGQLKHLMRLGLV